MRGDRPGDEVAPTDGGDRVEEFERSLSPMLQEDFRRLLEDMKDPKVLATVRQMLEQIERGEIETVGRWVETEEPSGE